MQRQIFRQAALERLSSPEQLDQLMQVTTLKGWLGLAVLVGMLVMALLWGIFGRLPTQVGGQGVLIRGSGVKNVVAAAVGQVMGLAVNVGDVVEEGQVLATFVPSDGGPASPGSAKAVSVTSPFRGRILDIMVERGSIVNQTVPLVSLESVTDPLEAVLYLPASEGKKVRPGMLVQVEPETASKQEFGFMRGSVRAVAELPATYSGMMRVLQDDRLAQAFLKMGAPVEVRVTLTPDASSPSGYRWSSSGGPPFRIGGGTVCRALITLREQRPISLVLPVLDD